MTLTRTNFEIIALLHTHEVLTQAQIAHKLNKTHTHVHTSVKRLEAYKIVTHESRGRSNAIILLDKDFAQLVYILLENEKRILKQWL